VGEVEVEVVVALFIADGAVRVSVVVSVEAEIIADSFKCISSAVTISIGDTGKFWLLRDDDLVSLVVLDMHAQCFKGSFCKEGSLLITDAPDAGGTGG
jgi:hypothetical protein